MQRHQDRHQPRYRPEFDPGLTLLDVPSPRSTVCHRLVCRHLTETSDSTAAASAYWIDARNTASTHALYDYAPSRRTLDGLRVARAFTAYQHHSLVRAVTREAGPDTDLIVAPNVGSLYRDCDLADYEREDLRAATLTTLSELGRVIECPVLVTSADGEDAALIEEYAETTIECVRTREGMRFERADGGSDTTDDAADHLTAGYWHGSYWQTTIPYWIELCGAVDEPACDPVVAAHDQGLLEVRA